MTERRPIAVSVGCPAGVGPSVALRAASRLPDAPCLLVGDPMLLRGLARRHGVAGRRLVPVDEPAAAARLRRGQIGLWSHSAVLSRPIAPGRVSAAAGAAQLAWIDAATDLVRRGICRALVTAPASKAAVAASGSAAALRFSGHTEHLARRLGAREVVMAFWSPRLVTSLVTTHLPLGRVASALSPPAVGCACYWLVRLLAALGVPHPRVAVAALNPHAGEGGLWGDEERRIIAPGMRLARRRLRRAGVAAKLVGPLGAETAYRLAARGQHAGVVAMYHDQATIACKLLDFGRAVNVSLGLPIVRTSVDHGTAYDLAHRPASASCRPMLAAVRLASRLASTSW